MGNTAPSKSPMEQNMLTAHRFTAFLALDLQVLNDQCYLYMYTYTRAKSKVFSSFREPSVSARVVTLTDQLTQIRKNHILSLAFSCNWPCR